MFRSSVFGLVSAVALMASANAADVYRKDEGGYKDGPVYLANTWTGFYVGAHGGYIWADPDFPGAPSYPAGPPRPKLSGGFVGGQIGYNHQFDRIVLGVVADISFANLEETVRDGNYLTETTKIDRFGTVRALAGYSFGRWLPYGTVGFAWGDTSYNFACPDQAAAPFGLCSKAGPRRTGDSQTLTGLAYGGGLKYAIDGNFSIGAEYLRLDLDETTFSYSGLASIPAFKGKIDGTADLVKVQVDYKFGSTGYEPLK